MRLSKTAGIGPQSRLWPHRRVKTAGLSALAILSCLALTGFLSPYSDATSLPMPPAVVSLQPDLTVSLMPGSALPAGSKSLAWSASGRWQTDAQGQGLLHEWPGLTVDARFIGDTVLLAMDDTTNRFRLRIDGQPVAIFTRPGQAVIRISGLTGGAHDLRLERLSEAWVPARIVGLGVPASGTALEPPARPLRRIDIFGDSDTVGYGNTSPIRACPGDDIFLTTDTTLAWPRLLADHFAADASVAARSGIGLIRNNGGANPGRGMAILHDRLLPSASTTPTIGQPAPWLSIIALGDNDFAGALAPDEVWSDTAALEADFAQRLDAFLRNRLAAFPNSPILLVKYTDAGVLAHDAIATVADALTAQGKPVTVVTVPKLERSACDWHPSLADHALISATLTKAMDEMISNETLASP